MSKQAKIPAVQYFRLDEAQSQQGPVVVLTVTLSARIRDGKMRDIDIGLSLDQADVLGRKLVELTNRLRATIH